METNFKITEPERVKDYFPALFVNSKKTIVVFGNRRTGDQSFSGMVISAAPDSKARTAVGTYSESWTYSEFSRLPKGTKLELTLLQGE